MNLWHVQDLHLGSSWFCSLVLRALSGLQLRLATSYAECNVIGQKSGRRSLFPLILGFGGLRGVLFLAFALICVFACFHAWMFGRSGRNSYEVDEMSRREPEIGQT